MKKINIYADNSATTPLAPEALEAMMPFLTNEYGNPSSLYSFSSPAKRAVREAREVIAECIHAEPEEIIFTSGGTESNNWVIKEMHSAGGTMLYSPIEHYSVLNAVKYYGKLLNNNGKGSGSLSVGEDGVISLADLDYQLSRHVSPVSVMFANNEIGTIEPIGEIAKIAHYYGTVLHTDAVQAIGHIPVNVNELDVDYLSASAHKFRGPKGIGFLYSKKRRHLAPLIYGGHQEDGLRAGTENVAAIVGMSTALKISCEEMQKNQHRLNKMTEEFHKTIKAANSQPRFNGSIGNRLPGHISLSIPGISGEALMHYLDLKGIAVSTGSACNSKQTEISHVLRAILLPEKAAEGTIRITFAADNKPEDASIVAQNIINYIRLNQ